MMEDDITRNPLTRAPQLQLGIVLVKYGVDMILNQFEQDFKHIVNITSNML